jgi:glycine cleavage system protein P-like pyridoxal-binding family
MRLKCFATSRHFEFCNIHPFPPNDQVTGYHELIEDLNRDLSEITGFAAVSAQPNAGATGEYAELLAIKKYLASKGEGPPQYLSHSQECPWNEPCKCCHGMYEGCGC